MSHAKIPVRDLNVKDKFQLSRFLVKWEMILIYILVIINLALVISRPSLYFAPGTISSIIQSGMDLSFMVMAMIFVLMLGDIDISIASIMIVCSMVTGLLMDAGASAVIAVVCGILIGGVCGAFNGFLIAKIKMPSVIVTISTAMLFRGIVKIVLDVNVLKNFPKFYSIVAWNNVAGIPITLICFLAVAALFALILHRTRFGRELYMIGNSETVALYSGINVDRTRIIVFIIMGLMAGISSVFFVGRMGGGVSSTMGAGYELNVIAICVLGGISTNGGKGKVYGPVIATLIMAFLIYTLGLMGVDVNSRKILIGIILIIAVLIPNVNKQLIANIKLKLLYANNKNVEAVNIKYDKEVKTLKYKISEMKKASDISEIEKNTKIKEYQDKITGLKGKCKETTASLKEEIKAENQKIKKRFAD
jgi:rhamnose transport system permease protein